MLHDGQKLPGLYLGEGRKGNRQWIAGEFALDDAKPDQKTTVEAELKKRLGAGGAYVKKMISVAEAEKAFKPKPRTWAKIAPLITQADGKPKVCREGVDKNKPYQLPSADSFEDLTKTVSSGLLDD